MSRFTRGEWKFDEYIHEGVTLNGKQYIIFAKDVNKDHDVALVKRKEDALLIAAAPEMYELLKFFCEDKAIDEDRFDDYLTAIFEAKKLFKSIDGDIQEAQ